MDVAKTPKLKLKLTDSAIRAIVVPDGRSEVLAWDAAMPGLALRVGRQRRSWTYVFRVKKGGAPQKLGLGAWPAVSIAAARQAAQLEAGRLARGEDPAAARREARSDSEAVLATVLDDYEASLKRRRYASVSLAMSVLRRGLAKLLKRDVASLTRKELVSTIDRLSAAGKPGAAAELRKHTRTLLDWATNKGLTQHNVLAGYRRERTTRAERIQAAERGRALTRHELAALWHAADPATVLGRYVRALILTGARRTEMARLDWSMVGDDRLTLPPTHTKQGRPHEIPIGPALRAILDACQLRRDRPVFASPITGGEMKGWSQHFAKLRTASGVLFTPHDLRRTMRTGLTDLGVDFDTAELMLGHQRDDLVRRYDKAERWAARVEAAEQWAAYVERVAGEAAPSSENVIRLNTRKARAA